MTKTLRRRRGDDWSPYGHEKARRRLLMERQAFIALGAVALVVLYGLFLQLTLSVETNTSTGGGTIEIRQDEMRPVTVSVTPGRAPTFMQADANAPPGIDAPGRQFEEQPFLIRTVAPFLPLVAPLLGALWLLSRVGASARGKLAELNLGVYKGAMPYEMHTVRAQDRVFTHREVKRHVFGKLPADFLAGSYLGRPPLAVRRLLGDTEVPDNAEITRLAQGRRAAVRPRPAPARPNWKPAVVAQDAQVRRLRPPQRETTETGAKATARNTLYGLLDAADRLVDRVADRLEPLARRVAKRDDKRAA